MTETITEPAKTDTSDSDLVHLVCCDEDVALCGADVPGDCWGPDWELVKPKDKCIVCYDLDGYACPRCGYRPG